MIDEAQKHEIMFQSLVMMFETAAMQHMGKLKNPMTDKVEKDLEQAHYAIDILDMLQVRTKNNLIDHEKRWLESVTASLKLTYVDEISKSKQEAATAQSLAEGKQSEEQTP